MLAVTILGNNSAVPAFDRHPTSQVVVTENERFLVDCGEGTQIQMINYKIRRSKISHIFISHLHGDHYFGLAGLINTFNLLNRHQELHVFGPSPLQEIISMQLKVADTIIGYPLHFYTITKEGILVDNDKICISCFCTNHRIECYGFSFTEKKGLKKLDPDKAGEFGIPVSYFNELKKGLDYTKADGSVVKNEWVTGDAPRGRKYVYCADTKYDESIIPHIQDADLVYHETTYLDNLQERASQRFHTTSKQAALLAKKAGVKKLLIGHFSSKYPSLEEFETEAREIFENTELAIEGVSYKV